MSELVAVVYIKPLNEHLSKRYSSKATLENESGKKIIYLGIIDRN